MQPASTPEQHACMELTRTQRSTGTGSAELAWASPLLFRPSAVAQDLVCEAFEPSGNKAPLRLLGGGGLPVLFDVSSLWTVLASADGLPLTPDGVALYAVYIYIRALYLYRIILHPSCNTVYIITFKNYSKT